MKAENRNPKRRPGKSDGGFPVMLFVGGIFGVVISIFAGIALYLYFATTGTEDMIGIMRGFAWLMATCICEVLIVMKKNPERAAEGSDAKALAEKRQRIRLTAMNVASVVGLTAFQLALYQQGRTDIGSLVFTTFFVFFMSVWISQKWRPAEEKQSAAKD